MKTKILYFSIISLMLFSVKIFGQEDFAPFYKNLLENTGSYELVLYSNLNNSASEVNSNEVLSNNNNVFIEQIGNNNLTNAHIVAEESMLDLKQTGNYNSITIMSNVKSIDGTVVQNGNHNYSFDFVNDPTQEVTLNLIQNGNGHHFVKYGTNSIGNKLKFKMNGDSQSIIVRNFK